jgi:hypothetical protein
MEMRSTQELREEIIRRAEHKKRAKRALYRRMGTLCLLLCLCTGVMAWGMLGQTAPESSRPTESTVSLQQTLQGDPSLPHEEENSAEGNSAAQEDSSETVSNPGMEVVVPDESFSGEAFLPEESAPEEAPPVSSDDPENPNEEGLLPTVVLLAVPADTTDGLWNSAYIVQDVLTQGTSEFDAGDTLQVALSTDLTLYGGESILAVGEWQNGVFLVEKGDWMLFRDEMEDEESSVLGPDWEDPEFDPPCEDPGLLPPESSSVLTELLAEAGKFPVKDTSTRAALELFCALEQLYDEYGG